jgi:hypothetical protein
MKFSSLSNANLSTAKKGTKAVDKAPILRASVAQGMFRINQMLSRELNVKAGDSVIFTKADMGDDGVFFILNKDLFDNPNACKLGGTDANAEVGTQTLSFTFAGVYSEIFDLARKQFDIDTTLRYEIQLKIADVGNAAEIDPDFGDTPAVLLELSAPVLRNERGGKDEEEEVEEVED